jgi:pimeloyl-ACP methyl ester carboxylesterase
MTAGTAPVDLTSALVSRLRHTPSGPLLAGVEGSVLFEPDRGTPATVELHHGTFVPRRGRPVLSPTATVHGHREVLAAIIEGTDSGVRAFLDGDVTVRGDLSLTMALDGLFDDQRGAARPDQWPTAGLVSAGGIDTAYLDAGPRDGRPLLLLHGLGATNASLLPLLWDLAADHRVVAPDLPGFGASAAPRGSYAPAMFVPWALDLCRRLGLERPVVIGNSMGGRIAIELGLRQPAAVGGVVGLCASPAFRRLRQLVPAVRLLRPELARVPIKVSHGVVVRAVRAMFSQPDRLPRPWYDAAADEFVRCFARRDHRVAFFACARQIYLDEAFGLQGFWDTLPSLQPPALFIWGRNDRLVPASFSGHVAAALPGATSVVLDDCGHVPQFELPEETARLVRAFLAETACAEH